MTLDSRREQLGEALARLEATGEALGCMQSTNESLRHIVREKDVMLGDAQATIDELRLLASPKTV